MASRREFLRGIFKGSKEGQSFVPLPPYNQDRELFSSCNSCQGECISACALELQSVGGIGVLKHNGKISYIDFGVNGCLLCGKCASACPSGVLLEDCEANFNFMVKIDELNCLAYNKTMCYTCKDMCVSQMGNKGAIEFLGMFYPKINNECVSCGFCISVCPTNAIVLEEIHA
ncbi:4Fe-4S dicluster domain-containing protein [Helicobacter ibis]|uniref:4Fe-4S binding protein n=1 Tax=Helicobacter ibis TaxID=2962633 RepID=A0ABT4VCU1_9HELI|nr:4Fe-4S dicluster domain-containing protein [Helicobacter ibis]MDA3968519.1 4Fe-4S binding protein [Helicobacter ibis]